MGRALLSLTVAAVAAIATVLVFAPPSTAAETLRITEPPARCRAQ